ncbi:major facilitator superfamily transporter [Nitzschia inconspicua]|uniref:Major facilitator superfamily transporter n=1 Tax=Nitzschia inconspicua TaxID=303405 RepID=A0A9K3KE60_9STRA|nr:major facilitator superfamily transporter [Nitzschia inconspicua]
MCKPIDVGTTKADELIPNPEDIKPRPKESNSGFVYGTISMALVVTAGSVVMGHFQSKRDAMGCDTMCVGSMTSARSTLTLVGSTIIGKSSDSKALDDKLGGTRRAFLILGVLATALELVVAARADSVRALWVSMIPSALFQQNFNVLKALFGEWHNPSATAAERAGEVGKLGMAVGLAFMAGPLLGSVLFKTYTQAVVFASVCLIVALLFIIRLPKPMKGDKQHSGNPNAIVAEDQSVTTPSSFINRFVPDVPAARTPPAIFIMISRTCMALSFHIFNTIWQVVLRERFKFGPQDYGRYYAYIGFGFAVSQGYVAHMLLRNFGMTESGRSRLLLVCSCILGGGRLLAYQTDNIAVVYFLQGLIITSLGVVNTIFTADTSKIANPDQLGGLFGVLGSVESLAGIIGPILGGSLARIHPVRGPLMAVVLLYGTVFTLVIWGYERIIGRAKIDSVHRKND